MALERKLLAIAPVALTANGTQFGVVTVADTINFKDKQIVYLQSNAVPQTLYQVKFVISNTQMVVGPNDNKLGVNNFSSVVQFLVSDNASIGAVQQDKNAKPIDTDHYQAIYESSPTNADRVVLVDPYGDLYANKNPLPVSIEAPVNIGEVEVIGTNGNILEPNPDGSINVVIEGGNEGNPENIQVVYNDNASVPSGVVTPILTYTVPVGGKYSFQRILYSGENIGLYQLLINGTVIVTQRTYFSGGLNGEIEMSGANGAGYILNSGDIVVLQVLQNRGSVADYDASLELLQIIVPVTGLTFKTYYNEVTAATNVSTTILTYTVGSGINSLLQRVLVSGENIARFDVVVNSETIATKRTYFGGSLNSLFEFTGNSGGGLLLTAGTVVNINVIQKRPMSGLFEATIETIET